MKNQAILAVDEGTTNCKAVLVNELGKIIASGSQAVPISYPKDGWVEQDAIQIWKSTVGAVNKCLNNCPNVEVVALGISNQRESIAIWNRHTKEPIGPVISWQCRRTADICQELKNAGHEKHVMSISGLPLDPMFPATKIKWLLQNYASGIDPQDICIGTIDSWLIWKFSGCEIHATDKSNAARTQIFNLIKSDWDDSLCSVFEVSKETLPQIGDSSSIFGKVKGMEAIPDGIPIASAIGDSHAALFGHGANKIGDGKITFGTGSSIMTTIPEYNVPPPGLTTTIAWSIDGKSTFALEGNILVSASLLPWITELLNLESVDSLIECAKSTEDSLGVSVVPALVGLGSPHWNPNARGIICGLTFPAKPAHIARAALESIALQVRDVYDIMERESKLGVGRLFVDGGPSENTFLMTLVASILNHTVIKNSISEASACGAAFLAGLSTNFWSNIEKISDLNQGRSELCPHMDSNTRRKVINAWDKSIKLLTT